MGETAPNENGRQMKPCRPESYHVLLSVCYENWSKTCCRRTFSSSSLSLPVDRSSSRMRSSFATRRSSTSPRMGFSTKSAAPLRMASFSWER